MKIKFLCHKSFNLLLPSIIVLAFILLLFVRSYGLFWIGISENLLWPAVVLSLFCLLSVSFYILKRKYLRGLSIAMSAIIGLWLSNLIQIDGVILITLKIDSLFGEVQKWPCYPGSGLKVKIGTIRICRKSSIGWTGIEFYVVRFYGNSNDLENLVLSKPPQNLREVSSLIPFGILRYTARHIQDEFYLLKFKDDDPVLFSDSVPDENATGSR